MDIYKFIAHYWMDLMVYLVRFWKKLVKVKINLFKKLDIFKYSQDLYIVEIYSIDEKMCNLYLKLLISNFLSVI